MKHLLIALFMVLCTTLNAQTTYYTFNNEGPYILNEEWVGLDCDGGCEIIKGYWTDTIFHAGRIQYIFTDKGITKLTKLFFQGRVYKNCSILSDVLGTTEEGSVAYPMWSITREYLNGTAHTYLLGFSDFDVKPIVRVLVTNVAYNLTNKTIRGEQNGLPFYLWNGINNELTNNK